VATQRVIILDSRRSLAGATIITVNGNNFANGGTASTIPVVTVYFFFCL